MSDVMLLGVLRMPIPEKPDPMTLRQFVARAHEAANRIEADAARIERLTAEVAQLRAGWRPIETAPTDGTMVLLAGCRKQVVAAWVEHDIEWWHVDDNKHGPWPLRGPAPTHWMPLPPPPGQPIGAPIAPEHAAELQALSDDAVKRHGEMVKDAARYQALKRDFSVASPNIDGQHAWAYRRNFSLKGPSLDAAIDQAMKDTP